MKIHIRQIPSEGLHLDGEEEFPLVDVVSEDVRSAGKLRYSLDLGISEDSLWATGSLSQPVELRCVRCLERFPYNIEVKKFSIHLDLPGPEEVDLTPYLREDILLNLPPHPHCDREGGRVCPAPATLQETNTKLTESSSKQEHDWSELDKLRLKQ
jgi:uncharacterized metal-binding protein YceD (DUF177 family)